MTELTREWARIMRECLYHYLNFSMESCVVENSIPVLYFGNEAAYTASPIKVITVALNPSDNEFPEQNRTERFAYAFENTMDFSDTKYRDTLNDYFTRRPLEWFRDGFEPVLEGFGSSYFGAPANTVLHTDFCAPIATNPKWSSLGERGKDDNWEENKRLKARMQSEGSRLWAKLVELLQPDVMFMCLNNDCNIPFARLTETVRVLANQETGPEETVWHSVVRLGSGKEVLMIEGQTWNVPFGGIKYREKWRLAPLPEVYMTR